MLNYHGELLVETGELDAARAKFELAISVSGGKFALAHVNQGVRYLVRVRVRVSSGPCQPGGAERTPLDLTLTLTLTLTSPRTATLTPTPTPTLTPTPAPSPPLTFTL